MQESTPDSLSDITPSDSGGNLNANNSSDSVVSTEESSQQVSQEEIERRKREAEELFYGMFLFFSLNNNKHLNSGNDGKSFDKNTYYITLTNYFEPVLKYLVSSEEIRKEGVIAYISKNKSDAGITRFNNNLDFNNISIDDFNPEMAKMIISDREFNLSFLKNFKTELTDIQFQNMNFYIQSLKILNEAVNNRRLYNRILNSYHDINKKQILTATLLFKHSPWYNKWSVFTYFSKEDLDVISEIYEYFSPIDNPRAFFRYFYNNRKMLSHEVNKFKFNLASRFVKSGLKLSNANLNEFSQAEQEFIMTWSKSPNFIEVIMDGNFASVNVVKNLYAYCKIYDKNPIEVIRNAKLVYKKNYDGAELPNSDLRALLNVDVIESLSEFKNIMNPKFLTLEKIQEISQNEKLKEIMVASLINNSFERFAYNGINYFPPNFLSENPMFSSIFLIYADYVVQYHKEISADLLSEIMNYVVNNYNDIILGLGTIKEDAVDGTYDFFANLLGFKLNSNNEYAYYPNNTTYKLNSLEDNPSSEKILKIIATAQSFLKGFSVFHDYFSYNLTLITISILECPSNITSFIDKFNSNNSESFINKFAICIKTNEVYKERFIEALANINLNLVQNIFENPNIAQLYKNESNKNLKQKVIDKKRESLPEDFDKGSLSNNSLFCLPTSAFEKEKLDKLKDLNDIISELPIDVINWAIAKPDEIPVIKNIATAQNVNDIRKDTINLFDNSKKDCKHPIFPFFVQKLLNKIPFNEIKDKSGKVLNLEPLNNAIIKHANSKAREGALSALEMENLQFTLSQISAAFLSDSILHKLSYENIMPQLKIEKATRDVLNQVKQTSSKGEQEIQQQLLYCIANTIKIDYIMNKKGKGVPDEQNESLYILNEVSKRLAEDSLAKTIFSEVAEANYENAFREKLSNLQNTQGSVHPLSLAQSFSQHEDIQL